MTTLEIIALFIATLTGVASFIWQVFRYLKEGPSLRILVSQGMTRIPTRPGTEQDKLVSMAIANVGSQATTLTHFIIMRFANRFDRILRRPPVSAALVPMPSGTGLPCKLTIGDEWIGMMKQKDLDEEFEEEGFVYLGVHHTFARRPCLVRVDPETKPLVNPSESV